MYCVRSACRAVVGSVGVLLEGSDQDPVLDRRSHLSGHVGEGGLLRRVPEHQI